MDKLKLGGGEGKVSTVVVVVVVELLPSLFLFSTSHTPCALRLVRAA